MIEPPRRATTFEECFARGDAERMEVISGELAVRPTSSTTHGFTVTRLAGVLGAFNHHLGNHSLGGWWLFTRIHAGYPGGEIYCHDTAGWRRDHMPERPTEWPVRDRLDWVCEVVSREHQRTDLVLKPRTLHAAGVMHYWVIDPEERFLLVHRWSPEGYIVVQSAVAGDVVRAEPFDAIELRVGDLFGDEAD